MIFTIMDSVLKSYITRALHQLQDVYAFILTFSIFGWPSLRFNNNNSDLNPVIGQANSSLLSSYFEGIF